MKRKCPKCGEVGEFHKTASACKSCIKVKCAKWYQTNKDYGAVVRKIWYYKSRLTKAPKQLHPEIQQLIQQLEHVRDLGRMSRKGTNIEKVKQQYQEKIRQLRGSV